MSESIASEVISASLGGVVSASILYPLEVLKTKMQAETKKDDDDGDNDNEEDDRSNYTMFQYASYLYENQGPSVFLSGIETSAFQSAAEKALYFFAYTGLKGIYRGLSGNAQITTIPSLVMGCLAEWAHLPLTLPLDCWTTAIQTNTDKSKGPMTLLLAMLSEKVRLCYLVFLYSLALVPLPPCRWNEPLQHLTHIYLFLFVRRVSRGCTRVFKRMSFSV